CYQFLDDVDLRITDCSTIPPRQTRRIEDLGELLTIHLDNDKLHAELLEKIEALGAERDLREQFVSVLAHDLRGPLSTAKMNAHLLIRHAEALHERRAIAIKIERNINRTDRMIHGLLDANQIRAGERLPLRLDQCDLGGGAREVIEELASIHGERVVLSAADGIRGVWIAEEVSRA